MIGLAVASPASAASFEGPPPPTFGADITFFAAGPYDVIFMLRGMNSNTGPIEGITAALQGQTDPTTWVTITAGLTSSGSGFMPQMPKITLSGYLQLRCKATINGVDYYSGGIAPPS